jgi:hypothetical protein
MMGRMLLRAALIAGLASLTLTASAGAASPHLSAPGYAALTKMLRAGEDPAVSGAKDPVAALRKVCRSLSATDAQSRLLRRDCVASTDLVAGSLAVLDCPSESSTAKIAACARTQSKRIAGGAKRSSAVERTLAAQVSGGCRSYFRQSITQNHDVAAYYGAVLENLAQPGTHTDAEVARLQKKLQSSPAQNRRVKREAASCKPA